MPILCSLYKRPLCHILSKAFLLYKVQKTGDPFVTWKLPYSLSTKHADYCSVVITKSKLKFLRKWYFPFSMRLGKYFQCVCLNRCKSYTPFQGSASECVLVMLLAARHKAMKDLKKQLPYIEDGVLLSKLVAYSSKLVRSLQAILEFTVSAKKNKKFE